MKPFQLSICILTTLFGSFLIQGCQPQENISEEIKKEPATGSSMVLPPNYVQVGDMILHRSQILIEDLKSYWPSEYQAMVNDLAQKGIAGEGPNLKLWPKGVVPIEFDFRFPRDLAKQMISYWQEIEAFADIKIVQRTDETHYVKVAQASDFGCGGSSFVGMTGGLQYLSLFTGCPPDLMKKVAQHELMHALGIHHEQNRSDRDDHINVHFNNIEKGMEGQYARVHNPYAETVDYDFYSIMHYDGDEFAKGGSRTMSRKYPHICQGPNDPYHDDCKTQAKTSNFSTNKIMSKNDREMIMILYGPAN